MPLITPPDYADAIIFFTPFHYFIFAIRHIISLSLLH